MLSRCMNLNERPDIQAFGGFLPEIVKMFEFTEPEVKVNMLLTLRPSTVHKQIIPSPDTLEWFMGQPEGEAVHLRVVEKNNLRTLAQNRLYRKWVGEIADHRGETKVDMHTKLRMKYCHAWLLDPDVGHEGYQVTWAQISELQDDQDRRRLEYHVRKNICSTTMLTVKGFSGMLNELERDARMKGIPLTVTGEIYELSRVG